MSHSNPPWVRLHRVVAAAGLFLPVWGVYRKTRPFRNTVWVAAALLGVLVWSFAPGGWQVAHGAGRTMALTTVPVLQQGVGMPAAGAWEMAEPVKDDVKDDDDDDWDDDEDEEDGRRGHG